MSINLKEYIEAVDWLTSVRVRGKVSELLGPLMRASVPGARIGELCLIRSPHRTQELQAEVVGFRDGQMILLPLGESYDVAMDAEVIPTGRQVSVRVSNALLGRVLNGLGEPMDGRGEIQAATLRPVMAVPPDPLRRQRVTRTMATGVRAIDGLLTVGEGQRIGIFSAAGVGKSTLLGMLARNTEADINVIALVGERGREVRDFLEADLGPAGLQRSVVVVATSNEPSLVRLKSAYVATTIAEYFRELQSR